ncbi:hypothetical protein RINTHH_3350 [Richelia intracellularis HH01]|uniref:Uncharacterized protein n=1 Tax=Richelia intracellularis HH01 TaxID=1165094 RepID=M1X2A6_9NOST|nr:hypothetical protein RINTHH_3350 [Richelia intracellularis HH01]
MKRVTLRFSGDEKQKMYKYLFFLPEYSQNLLSSLQGF